LFIGGPHPWRPFLFRSKSKTGSLTTDMLVRVDHLASVIINANHSIVRTAGKLRLTDCVTDGVWLAISQPAKWLCW
jgi:hypothetical protein